MNTAAEWIIEDVGMTQFSVLTEDKGAGLLMIRGEFGRVDVPTQNKRLYTRKLIEREIGRLDDKLDKRAVYGELDHPTDGKTKFHRVSHIITKLSVEDDGRIMGEAQVLDTPAGNILKAVVKANGSVGVSSRGFGSLVSRQDGVQEVGEDFRLKTFDAVVDPAMDTARPGMFAEALQESADHDWLGALKTAHPELCKQIEEDEAAGIGRGKAVKEVTKAMDRERATLESRLTERFEKRLVEGLLVVRSEVEEELREAQESDPRRIGAVAVIERVSELVAGFAPDTAQKEYQDAMKAKDRKIAKLEKFGEEWKGRARDAGYKLCLEREISGHSAAESIRASMGDLSQFNSLDDVRAAVKQMREDLAGSLPGDNDAQTQDEAIAVAEANGRASALQEQVDRLEAERSTMTENHADLQLRLRRAVEIGEHLNTQLDDANSRAEQAESVASDAKLGEAKSVAISGYANRGKLEALLEGVTDIKQIARIVQSHGGQHMSDPGLESIRSRIGRGTVHDDQATELAESKVRPRGKSVADLGIGNLDQHWIAKTSGVIQENKS